MTDEYNATTSDLKKGDCFKFVTEYPVKIVMATDGKRVTYFDLGALAVGSCPITKNSDVILIPRKEVLKKGFRYGR